MIGLSFGKKTLDPEICMRDVNWEVFSGTMLVRGEDTREQRGNFNCNASDPSAWLTRRQGGGASFRSTASLPHQPLNVGCPLVKV